MKLIFLDFDGVLNTIKTAVLGDTRPFLERKLVAKLNSLVMRTGADIVVTSSWRRDFSTLKLSSFLETAGLISGCVIGKTQDLGYGTEGRSQEIETAIAALGDVSSFVILDDHYGACNCSLEKSFVHVDSNVGLTDENVSTAATILCGSK